MPDGRPCRPTSRPKQLEDPRHRRGRADPATLRALRLLHRHLPDLRAARRRARQPARAHLPDEGHVRERPHGERRRSQQHVDRCLSCLSCMTTCPSGVDYMHLVDHARAHIEETGERSCQGPAAARACWRHPALSRPLPPGAGGWRALGAAVRRADAPRVGLSELVAMLDLAPPACCAAPPFAGPGTAADHDRARGKRVILLAGCAQQVLRPEINDATIRLLARRGVEVEVRRRAPAAAARSCITWARRTAAHAFAKRNVDAWMREIEKGEAVDAIIDQRLGLRHHGQGLRPSCSATSRLRRARGQDLPAWPRDVTEFLGELRHGPAQALVVAARRLSLGLLDAAWPAHHRRAAQAPAQAPASP